MARSKLIFMLMNRRQLPLDEAIHFPRPTTKAITIIAHPNEATDEEESREDPTATHINIHLIHMQKLSFCLTSTKKGPKFRPSNQISKQHVCGAQTQTAQIFKGRSLRR